jgi:hypothetical protein
MRGIVQSFALIFPLLIAEGWCQITNEQIVSTTVKAAAIRELGDFQNQRIIVVTDGAPLNGIIASTLADALRNKSAEVMLASQPDSTSENLAFKILNFEFKYKKGSGRGFLRQRRIKREFQSQLQLTLESGVSSDIIATYNLPLSYNDQIDPGALASVKSDEIPELAPKGPGRPISKLVKPALVVASVTVLVYLFFANK